MTTKEILKIVKWARKNGATTIKVAGLELGFGENEESAPSVSRIAAPEASIPPNLAYLQKKASSAESASYGPSDSESRSTAQPGVRSEEDDPDAYARKSDQWANYKPLPRGF